MNAFFHLFRRQVADQRYFFAAALAIGFSPYLVAPFAATNPAELAEVRLAVARVVLASFLIGVPLVKGARWLVADFGNGRRGFELARPVSAWALCSSKLAAIALMIFGGALLVSLPTTMATPDLSIFEIFRRGHADLPFVWLVLLPVMAGLGVWAVFTFSQAMSFLLADRGRLALADFGTLLLFVSLLGYAYRRFDFYGAGGIAGSWLVRLALAVAILGAVSAWRSFQAGSLLDRAHRRHSLAMNLGLLALGSVTALAAAWVVRPDPDRLIRFTLALPNADASRWLVAGEQDIRGFEPLFAAEPDRKQATYLAPRWQIAGDPRLSADGSRLAVFHFGGGSLRLYEFASGASRGILDTQVWEKNSLYLTVDDRLDWLVTLDAPGDLRAFSVELPGGRELFHVKDKELRGSLMQIVHRDGSRFDILVHRHDRQPDVTQIWTVNRFAFDAKTGELRRGEPWSYPPGYEPREDPAWWREALPLLDAGTSFSQLAPYSHITALEGGRGVRPAWISALTENAGDRGRKREWIIFDAENSRLGSFEARPDFLAVGEIRPGLLLVGRLSEMFETNPRRGEHVRRQTLVVEVPSGRILRVLNDFAPMKHPQGGKRVWLVDRYGEPYDLESAAAEPRPILPWRTLSARR